MSGKRKDYISWETYFMLVAIISRERSKDPSTQVGAVIVKDNRIVSVGYNGTPKGMSDDDMPWDSLGEKNGNILETKNPFVIHAEANAIYNLPLGTNLDDATMYVTLSPCHECAKMIASSGIKKVVYLEKYRNSISSKLTDIIFSNAGVTLTPISNIDSLIVGLEQSKEKLMNLKNEKNIRKIEYKK